MTAKPRHPYVILRWAAGTWLMISLLVCALSPEGFASLAKSLDFRLQSAVYAALWLASLACVTRLTPWLTLLVLLLPLAWFAPLAMGWALWDAYHTNRPFLPMLVAAPLLGISVLYYRHVWLWWLNHPRHARESED